MASEKPRSFAHDLKTPSQKIVLLLVFVLFALFRSSSIELTSKCGNRSPPLNAAMFVLKEKKTFCRQNVAQF
jgi:hypothetical protein